MRNALLHEAGSGAGETPDYPITVVRHGESRTRQIDAAKALFSATGVKREDLAARQESFLGNFRFFGAQHVAFLSMPDWCVVRESADLGMFAQYLMLDLPVQGPP